MSEKFKELLCNFKARIEVDNKKELIPLDEMLNRSRAYRRWKNERCRIFVKLKPKIRLKYG